ncbi:MAG: tetratricopeptide repeat protein [Verrucomicrobiia bacterium]|jgi:tetratricopeptide (TPR) repeat protein
MAAEPNLHSSPPARRLFARPSWPGIFLLLLLAGQGCGDNQSDRALDRGLEAYRTHADDLAITEFSEVIRLRPDYADAYSYRGLAYHHKGDDDRAIADYGEAIRLKPDSVNAYIDRGHAYDHKGDDDRAVADFNEVIRLDPNQATAYIDRGNAYNRKGDYDRAIADYDEAMRLNLDYAPVCEENRAYAYSQKGDYERAILDYSDAIRLKPDDPSTYYNRGLVYHHKGDDDKAIADFNEAVRLNPGYVLAYNELAWLLAVCPDAHFRDGEKAVECAQKACELSEWKIPVYFSTLAAAYAEAGDFDDAVKWENKSLASNASEAGSEKARQRLSLYEQKKPYREEKL